MASNTEKILPERIFVGPSKDGRSKVEHERCLFEVIEWYKNGTPRMIELIPLDVVLEVGPGAENRRFITGYVPKYYLDPKDSKGDIR